MGESPPAWLDAVPTLVFCQRRSCRERAPATVCHVIFILGFLATAIVALMSGAAGSLRCRKAPLETFLLVTGGLVLPWLAGMLVLQLGAYWSDSVARFGDTRLKRLVYC